MRRVHPQTATRISRMTIRILHIAHQQLRKFGNTRVSWGRKLDFGFIKAGYDLHNFSDRDVAAFESPLGIRPWGKKRANQRLLEMVEHAEPDLVVAGHCDTIYHSTLAEIRRMRPNVKIAHINCDPLFVPSNVERIKLRGEVSDAVFVSTGKKVLDQVFANTPAPVYHMPNSVEPTVERFDVSTQQETKSDLLFCSKSTEYTTRGQMVSWLRQELPTSFTFRTPGSFGEPGVWALDYDRALANTKMGLNLNRQEGDYWYSSDRMAHFGGNGVLVVTHAANRFDTLFPDETLVYFNNQEELRDRLVEFHNDDAKRRDWAGRTRKFFHEHMNATQHAKYIVEKTMGLPLSEDYVWERELPAIPTA